MSWRNKQITTKLVIASVGFGFMMYLAKHRGRILQRLKEIKCGLFGPLCHQQVFIAKTFGECIHLSVALQRRCSKFRVLGFDCEWVSTNGSRHPVALLQLAADDGLCALIRLCKFHHIPRDLKALLEDPSILKVGVVPSDDARYLFRDYGVNVRGCLDLRHLVVQTGSLAKGGLAGLSESILGVKLDKNWRVRCSDWEAGELSEKQVDYAARDALVAIEIFKVLMQSQLQSRSHFWQPSYWKSVNRSDKIFEACKSFIDVKYKNKPQQSTSSGDAPTLQHIPKNEFAKQGKSNPKSISRAYSTRQKPLYSNCYMQAPDGVVLCTCDKKKADWYLWKNLADIVCTEPFTVRLKFEPSGRAVGEVGSYYTQVKANCCVVCGRTDTYVRKNIVPHEYRKFFPRVMKDHTSHDVLLLCLDCHQRSNMSDSYLRDQLAVECSAPIGTLQDVKCVEVPEVKKIRLAAKALLTSADKIPEPRKEELKSIILSYFKDYEDVDKELLEQAKDLQSSVWNPDYEPHGLKVVKHYSQDDSRGLVCLEELWREHFLSSMKPRFMPALWSVSHSHNRLVIRAEEKRIEPQDLCVAGLHHLAESEPAMCANNS